ncbi:uncharacterized protein LOC143283385 isoform X2 [Babylonia areolata]
MELFWSVFGMFLFLVEAYHVLAHMAVLFRFRLLPRKDLVRVRYYFLVDGLTSFLTAFFYTGHLRWLVSIHVVQHLYYYFAWERTRLAKRIVNWSSLDWFQSPKAGGVEMDNILGTLFDIVVHVCNLCLLAPALSALQMVLLLSVAITTMLSVFYNPRLAWSSPSTLPAWVQRRIKPLPDENGE